MEDLSSSKINELQSQGYSDSQIYDTLKREGYNSVQIDDAIRESKLGGPMPEENYEDVPEPGFQPSLLDRNQKSTETIVEENIMPQENEVSAYSNFDQGQISNFQSKRGNLDQVEALVESIIEEKWKNSLQRFGNLDVWKERMKTDVASVKQELIRMEHRLGNIEKAVLGKISEYDKNIVNIGNEMKVLEQVFQKIISPLTSNIKELSRITKELKK